MPKVNKPKSTDIQEQLAKKLQALRQQKDVSQSEIAKYIELSVGAYQNYENGRREANYETLCKLADFYEVSTDYLLGRTPVKQMATEEPEPFAGIDISAVEKRIIEKYTALDKDMRAICIEVFRQLSGVVITENGEVQYENPQYEIQLTRYGEKALARDKSNPVCESPTPEQRASLTPVPEDTDL